MPKVVVVGCGISGLALAFRLQQRASGVEITVLEQSGRIGGKIWTHRQDGFQLEAGPNGFVDSKPSTLSLCRDLGLEDRLVAASDAASKNRYLYWQDGLRALPAGPGSLFAGNLLSWRSKLALLWEPLRKRSAGLGDESIDAFARRRGGDEVADVFADALVTGIYAGDPRFLSLPACFPRLAALEREHGSVIKGVVQRARRGRLEARVRGEADQRPGKMWSLREGLRLLVERLQERLTRPPLVGVGVRRIMRLNGTNSRGWRVEADGAESWTADAVVLTCPAYQQAAILADLDAELADLTNAIPYNRIVVVGLGYRRAEVRHDLDGFGYIAPQRTRRDVLGVQWCSSIFPQRAPSGCVLLRAMAGGWHRPDVAAWHDDRILRGVRDELRQTMGIDADPIFHRIVRWDRAIPQYHVGHLDRVARIHGRLKQHPGLFLGGNSYFGVAMNDCTEQADALAGNIQRFLAER